MHGSKPREWTIEYDQAVPPLPEARPATPGQTLPAGLYFIWIDPRISANSHIRSKKILAGNLRIENCKIDQEKHSNPEKTTNDKPLNHKTKKDQLSAPPLGIVGSGDLYTFPRTELTSLLELLTNPENKPAREKIRALQFRARDYRYYLRLAAFTPMDIGVIMGLEAYRFESFEIGWSNPETLLIQLPMDIPVKTRPEKDEARYVTLNSQMSQVGKADLLQISDDDVLRFAEIRTHVVNDSDPRLQLSGESNSGKKNQNASIWNIGKWEKALHTCKWDVIITEPPVTEVKKSNQENISSRPQRDKTRSPNPWSRFDLASLFRRKFKEDRTPNLDLEEKSPRAGIETDPWIYHILLVDEISYGAEKVKGIMFDIDSSINSQQRQAAAVAIKAIVDEGAETRLMDNKNLLNWTGLHEFGHMQGLYHNPLEKEIIMQPEHNLQTSTDGDSDRYMEHSDVDRRRLTHFPDLWVRPGGLPFGFRYSASALDITDLEPLSTSLNLQIETFETSDDGEPLFLVLSLENHSENSALCPMDFEIHSKSGRLGLQLETPSKQWEEVLPIKFPRELLDNNAMSLLPGEKVEYRIPWSDLEVDLRNAGDYRLYACISWHNPPVDNPAHQPESAASPELFVTATTKTFRVDTTQHILFPRTTIPENITRYPVQLPGIEVNRVADLENPDASTLILKIDSDLGKMLTHDSFRVERRKGWYDVDCYYDPKVDCLEHLLPLREQGLEMRRLPSQDSVSRRALTISVSNSLIAGDGTNNTKLNDINFNEDTPKWTTLRRSVSTSPIGPVAVTPCKK